MDAIRRHNCKAAVSFSQPVSIQLSAWRRLIITHFLTSASAKMDRLGLNCSSPNMNVLPALTWPSKQLKKTKGEQFHRDQWSFYWNLSLNQTALQSEISNCETNVTRTENTELEKFNWIFWQCLPLFIILYLLFYPKGTEIMWNFFKSPVRVSFCFNNRFFLQLLHL